MIAACPPFSIHHSESERQVLRQMRDQTIYRIIKLRRGANSALPFSCREENSIRLIPSFFSACALLRLPSSVYCTYRRVFRAALIDTWKHVRKRRSGNCFTQTFQKTPRLTNQLYYSQYRKPHVHRASGQRALGRPALKRLGPSREQRTQTQLLALRRFW